jgi:hypothetical protein
MPATMRRLARRVKPRVEGNARWLGASASISEHSRILREVNPVASCSQNHWRRRGVSPRSKDHVVAGDEVRTIALAAPSGSSSRRPSLRRRLSGSQPRGPRAAERGLSDLRQRRLWSCRLHRAKARVRQDRRRRMVRGAWPRTGGRLWRRRRCDGSDIRVVLGVETRRDGKLLGVGALSVGFAYFT